MSVWKFTIKPDSLKGYDAFSFCRQKSIIGIGWAGIFENKNINRIAEALQEFEKVPEAVNKIINGLKKGDFVWLQRNGEIFLCRIKDDIILFGQRIGGKTIENDIGFARNAEWVKIPHSLIPGKIHRNLITQKMIQRINCSVIEEDYYIHIFNKRIRNDECNPHIDESMLTAIIRKFNLQDFFNLLSPDDVEDIIASYLQMQGWVILKSTCFQNRHFFEFTAIRKNREDPVYGHIQIKSGNIQLRPADYENSVMKNELVILFSTAKEPYVGEPAENVQTLKQSEIFDWIATNTWALSKPVKLQLSIHNEITTN